MKVLTEWRGGRKGKRPAEESIGESSRKRSKDESGRCQSNGKRAEIDHREYRIRGTSTASKDLYHPSRRFPSETAPSPVATDPVPSPPPIHPDRQANIFNAASPTLAPPPPHIMKNLSTKPLLQSPERINDGESEEHRPKPLQSTSHLSLRLDSIRTLSSLDPRSPDYTPPMLSHPNERSRDSPSNGPLKPSYDSYCPSSKPPSRRQSDMMPPPPNATMNALSEGFTSKATSPPTNSDLERRHLSSTQPQISLLDTLNGFAQSIMSAASLTVKSDLAKQQAIGHHKERDRQNKHKATFVTLIEDAESSVEGVEKFSMGVKKQIDLSSEAQSKIAVTLASQLQKAEISDTPSSAHDRDHLENGLADIKANLKAVKKETDNARTGGRFKDDLAGLKANLKTAEKDIEYLNREAVLRDKFNRKLHDLATKDELRGLVTQDELRRVTIDEVRKHVTEALVPTEKKLASLTVEDANLNQKIKGVEAATHRHGEKAEENDQQYASRFGRLETSSNDMQMLLSRLELVTQEQKQECATIKVDLEAQDKVLIDLDTYVRRDPSNDDPSLDKLVMKNTDQIELLQQNCEKLSEAVRQAQDLRAAPRIASPPQISKASVNGDPRVDEELKLIRYDLDALKTERDKVVLIRTDLDSLINEEKLKDAGVAEGFEALEGSLNQQRQDLNLLQNEIRLVKQSQASPTVPNHPPTPPFASVSTSPREPDHQKLQDLELDQRKLTKEIHGLQLFVLSQQQKFDGLTSDRIVQSMVHQMQQLYPQHPGTLVNLVNQTVAGQARVDTYLRGHLKDRLANMESQISARTATDSKIEKVTEFTAESRRILLAAIGSLKQEIEGLKEGALNNRPQDPLQYGNRIDELAQRVTTVEARYIKAISEFQTNQADMVRNVTHLQHQNGIGSTRNTPGGLTIMSRSSKSVEPNGTAISLKSINDSDSSDTPLSHRGMRRHREGRRPSDPNLKRKAVDSDEDESGDVRPTTAKKIAKRRNVSGKTPFLE